MKLSKIHVARVVSAFALGGMMLATGVFGAVNADNETPQSWYGYAPQSWIITNSDKPGVKPDGTIISTIEPDKKVVKKSTPIKKLPGTWADIENL